MTYKINSVLGKISFTNDIFKNRDAFIGKLIDISSSEDNNWVGFGSRDYLEDMLFRNVFGNEVVSTLPHFEEENITKVIQEALDEASKLLNKKVDWGVIIFPTFSRFIVESMNGSFGFTPSDSLIHLYLNPGDNNKNFYKALEGATAHEYFHSARFEYFPPIQEPLLDTLVGEGLAENFKESITDNAKSPWVEITSIAKSKEIFLEIKDKLNISDPDFYRELFFNDEEYPLWSGYTVGYNLVKDYLTKQNSVDWNEIVKVPAAHIMEFSGWS